MSSADHPETKIHQKKGLPLFWIVPVLAIGVTAYLIYQTISERGPEIEIIFKSAKGLVEGKTALKYDGVKVGLVDSVKLSPNLQTVIVKAHLYPSASELARSGSQFWIVYPQIGLEGVTGLDTLIAGNHINIQAGKGPLTSSFRGLEGPPPRDPNSPDLYVTIYSREMPSLRAGAPVLFRKHPIGTVEELDFDTETHMSQIDVRIDAEYKKLIHKNSIFIDYSGININVGVDGIEVKSDSLISVAYGGIIAVTPDQETNPAPLAENDDQFRFFRSDDEALRKSAKIANTSKGDHDYVIELNLEDGIGITPEKTELRYKGVSVGTVSSIEFSEDGEEMIAQVTLERKLKHLAKDGTQFILVYPEIQIEGLSRLSINTQILKGAYIKIEEGEGTGELKDRFDLISYPREMYQPMEGLRVTLLANQVGKLAKASPVYYRGFQVGQIEGFALASDGTSVEIEAVIEQRYAALVRQNSRFWNVSGIDSQLSLMGGLQVKTQSFTGVFEGAVSFVTPENKNMGAEAEDGARYTLYEEPGKNWSSWKPTIPLN
ncbi:MAG: MlaD family protein [Verrucomicrobiota bacterium]